MPVPPPDRGPFLSALGWVDDLSQIPLNVLRGRPGAAARKTANSLGDLIDATLPYDLIPEFGEDDERVRASELFDIDPEVSPGIARATDIVGGAVTNPLSYFGYRGGSIRAGLPGADGVKVAGSDAITGGVRKLADKAAEYIPEPIKKSGRTVRRALNIMDVPEDGQKQVASAKGAGALARDVYNERVKQIYTPLTTIEQEAVGEIGEGIARNNSKDRKLWTTIDDMDSYLAGRTDIRPDVVKQAVTDRLAAHRKQWEEGLDFGVMGRKRVYEDVNGNRMLADDLRSQLKKDIESGVIHERTTLPDYADQRGFTGKILDEQGVKDYTPRRYLGDYFLDDDNLGFSQRGGGNSALAKRVEELKTKEQRLQFLQDTPDVDLEFNAARLDAKRAEQQGRYVQKAALGKAITGNDAFVLTDPDHQRAMVDAIKQIGETQKDYAYVLENLYKGIPPRGDGAFSKALHWGNQKFKSAATFGILLPRISFNVGNRASAVWQTLSEPGTAGTRMIAAKRALGDLLGAVDDGFIRLSGGTKGRWAPSELTQTIDQYEAALKAAKGDVAELRRIMSATPNGTHMLEAIDNGVMNGFVHSEMLLAKMARTPKAQRVADFMEWPAEIAKGVEQRMRLGTFLDLRKSNIDAPSAGLTTNRTYLDYSVPGVENRMFRDIVPFGAFLSQNIKQQAGLLARRPVVATVAAPFFANNEEDIKYPWMDNSLAVPTGEDETGNPQYITGFRTPIEGLTSVPGADKDDLLRDTIGNMQPLLKTGLSYIFDRDSFTGGEFGEYDKVLGQSAGELGRAYNVVRGTGLLQPFTGPIDQLSNALDDRKTIAQRAIQGTTGVRFNSVDPDLAKRQRIEDYLGDNPDAKQYTGYYQEGENEGLSDLLSQLNEAKAKLKAKREAAKAAF